MKPRARPPVAVTAILMGDPSARTIREPTDAERNLCYAPRHNGTPKRPINGGLKNAKKAGPEAVALYETFGLYHGDARCLLALYAFTDGLSGDQLAKAAGLGRESITPCISRIRKVANIAVCYAKGVYFLTAESRKSVEAVIKAKVAA